MIRIKEMYLYMASLVWLIYTLLNIVFYIIVAQAIMSWLIAFNILNTSQQFVYTIWSSLNRITEPVYRPLRRILPDLGGIDLAPMLVIVGILFAQRVLVNNFAGVY